MRKTIALMASCVAVTWISAAWSQEKRDDAKPQRVAFKSDLVAEAPGEWKVKESTKPLRLLEITLPSSEKGLADGQLVITHFGKGQGGGIDANLDRWYSQMEQPDGSASAKAAKKSEIKNDAAKITWVDIPGTLLDRPFPASPDVTKRPKYRLFAAMVDGGAEGPYWIRVTGPDSVLVAHRDAFEKFLKSVAKK